MKRVTFILAMLLSFGAFSQNIQWGQEYEPEDNCSIYDYIGSIGKIHYFSFGYESICNSYHFDRLGFMAVKDNNVINYSKEYINIPNEKLINSFSTDDNIVVLFSELDKLNEENYVKFKSINKTNFTEINEKNLFSYKCSKKDNPKINLFISEDRSKNIITYMNSNSKTDEGYLMINAFDKDLNELWSNKYTPETNGKISILNVKPTDSGEVFILSKVELTNGDSVMLLSKMTEDGIIEKVVSDKFIFNDTQLKILKDGIIFIADNRNGKFTGITYNFNKGEITNTVSLEYLKHEGNIWNMKDILQLENGNLVVVVEDAFIYIFDPHTSGVANYYNRNFYAICVNPNNSELVYSQLLSKATKYSSTRFKIKKGQFENNLYYTKGNDFFAIYNTDKDDNDLCGEIFLKTNILFPKGSDVVVTNQLHITQEGKPNVKSLFYQKEKLGVFSSNLSFKYGDGEVILGKMRKKGMSFGTLQINNN